MFCLASVLKHAVCFVTNRMNTETCIMSRCVSVVKHAVCFVTIRTNTEKMHNVALGLDCETCPSFCNKHDEYRKMWSALPCLCCETRLSFCYKLYEYRKIYNALLHLHVREETRSLLCHLDPVLGTAHIMHITSFLRGARYGHREGCYYCFIGPFEDARHP